MKCKNCGVEVVKHWQALAGCPVFTLYHIDKPNCGNPEIESEAVK